MDDGEFKKYVELIMSMCTDFLMGGLKKKVFIKNLKLIIRQIKEKDNEELADAAVREALGIKE